MRSKLKLPSAEKKRLDNLLEEMKLKYNYKFIIFQSDLMCFTDLNFLTD